VAHDVTTPEVVYVPVVFIHSDLPKGENFEEEGIIRHVDLYPTIMDIIHGGETVQADGVNLFQADDLPPVGVTWRLRTSKRFGDHVRVAKRDGVWGCSCPDHEYRHAKCKHI
jgi:hypothetical protein